MDKKYLGIASAKDASILTGLAFEDYLSQLFEVLGYSTNVTRSSGDYGADVIISKDDKTIVVQAKQYAGAVGLDAVKEAYFAKTYYKVDEAWVVTTSRFTQQAISGAAAVGVELITGRRLTSLIKEALNIMESGEGGAPKTAQDKAVGRLRRINRRRDFVTSKSVEGHEGSLVLVQYRGVDSKVTVPEGIRGIGRAAFVGGEKTICVSLREMKRIPYAEYLGMKGPYCKSGAIEEVILPDGVEWLGEHCFEGCERLALVSLPDSVRKIGSSAFRRCHLDQVEIRADVEYGEFVYAANRSLCEASIEFGVETIPTGCFNYTMLRSLEIPGTVRSIGNEAFSRSQLKHVEMQEGLVSIGASAFRYCPLDKVVIPEGVESIGSGAFADCKALHDVYLPMSLKSIALNAFDGCPILKGNFIGDVFDLEGVTLLATDPVYSRAPKVKKVRATTARADFEIDKWIESYRKTHRRSGYVDDIESAQIDAVKVRRGAGPSDRAELRERLKQMGLRDDLITRFIARRNPYG